MSNQKQGPPSSHKKSQHSKPTPGSSRPGPSGRGGAMIPAASQAVAPGPSAQQQTMTIGRGKNAVEYRARPVQPAKNYDVVSFARAMNDDFGPRVQKLFAPETEAALEAQRSGVYIGWRCPEFNHDCQRVSVHSKCFCGHLLSAHDKFNARSIKIPCKEVGCTCKNFAWIPSRPEDVGEFWFQRRRNFDPKTWRAKCRCKHTHEEHDPNGLRRCKKCGCGAFDSNFLCAACDRHWEQHETFFENEADRKEKGLPIGADYMPFAEIPSLRNMALTGVDDEDMSYMSAIAPPDMRPPLPGPSADNNTPVPFGQGRKSNFRPTYD